MSVVRGQGSVVSGRQGSGRRPVAGDQVSGVGGRWSVVGGQGTVISTGKDVNL